MRHTLMVAVAGACLLACAIPLGAHHSFTSEFSADQTVRLAGTLSKLEWVNPHVWIYIDVKGRDGAVTRWGVECGAPNAMVRRGARQDALSIGTPLTIDGYLAKGGKPVVKGRIIVWPDGRKAYVGSPEAGATR